MYAKIGRKTWMLMLAALGLPSLVLALLGMMMLGQALAQEVLVGRAGAGANARIEVLGAGLAQPGAVAPSQGRLVLYAPERRAGRPREYWQ